MTETHALGRRDWLVWLLRDTLIPALAEADPGSDCYVRIARLADDRHSELAAIREAEEAEAAPELTDEELINQVVEMLTQIPDSAFGELIARVRTRRAAGPSLRLVAPGA